MKTENITEQGRVYRRSDQNIRADICELLARDSDLNSSDISVEVEHGEVTLSGSLNSIKARRLAEEICEDVSGVVDVHNIINVNNI